MIWTADSTVSRRRPPRPSGIARTRSAASATAIARPTRRRWPSGRRCATSWSRWSASPRDGRSRTAPEGDDEAAAIAAEVGADDARRRTMRGDADRLTVELGAHQAELAKLEPRLADPGADLALPAGRRRQPGQRSRRAGDRGRPQHADHGGPGGRAIPPRPGDPRRPGPGPHQRDLPGRLHRAGHGHRPDPGLRRARAAARAAPPRAGRRPRVHHPAPPADARRGRPGRRDHEAADECPRDGRADRDDRVRRRRRTS